MNELISKATNEVFKPTFGARSDVESRIAIRLLLLYLCEKGVIDGGDYRSFVESVSDNASKMIEDESHPIPMSSNNQEEKDKLKDGIRNNLMSFVGHLPVNTKPSGYMLDGVPIEEFTQAGKLEKPENMAIKGTARMATVITEPNFMAGATAESMTIDGEPIEEAIKANIDSKRQPIKEQTLDEFNNARQVAYGNNVQVEPLTDSTAPPDNDSDSYVQEYPDHFIFTNKKTGKETKVDK